jgi:hypothetical protein
VLPLRDFAAVLRRDSNMSLYYLLLRPWAALGASEAWLRAPSALFGALALLPGLLLARRTSGSFLIFGLLALTNVSWLWSAQEARGYSLALLLNLLGVWAAAEGRWRLAAAALGLGLFAHFNTAFTIAAVAIWFVLVRRRISTEGAAMPALALGLLLAIPALLVLVRGRHAAPGWLIAPNLGLVQGTLLFLAGASRGVGAGLAVTAAVGIAALVGAVRALRSREPVQLLPLVWLAAGFVLPLAVSLVGPRVFLSKYLLMLVPALLLLAAHGFALAPPLSLAALVPAALLVHAHFAQPHKDDWRSASAELFARQREGDQVVTHLPEAADPLRYYAHQQGAQLRLAELGPLESWRWITSLPVKALASRVPRLWLVLNRPCGGQLAQKGPEVALAINGSYKLVERLAFGEIELLRYQSRIAPGGPEEPDVARPMICGR